MNRGTTIRAVTGPWYDGVDILIAEYSHHGELLSVAEEVVMEKWKPDDAYKVARSTLRITTESAQQLMDELWHCGLRPTEGTGSAGAMKAVEKHLEDMRSLVFKK